MLEKFKEGFETILNLFIYKEARVGYGMGKQESRYAALTKHGPF